MDIDPRLGLLSYSSLLLLNGCPKKYQLKKLSSQLKPDIKPDLMQEVTFCFGHIIGEAIQRYFAGCSLDDNLYQAYASWYVDINERNDKQKKSLEEALFAIQKLYYTDWQDKYELVHFNNRPAIELSFSIDFTGGFKYRGYVDIVLRDRNTGEIIICEDKTTSRTPAAATYKNSSQATGYSVILDQIVPDLSSYKLIYLIYQSVDRGWIKYEFAKSLHERALWLQQTWLDIETIKLYELNECWPARGQHCLSYYRECEYFGICHLSPELIAKPLAEDIPKEPEYDFYFTFDELIDTQMRIIERDED